MFVASLFGRGGVEEGRILMMAGPDNRVKMFVVEREGGE